MTMMNLHSNVEAIQRGLSSELGAAQREILSAQLRLRKIPDALLQNGSKQALDSTLSALDKANATIVKAMQSLHKQYQP